MGIWRNIGKIVILLFQIVHEQVKWTILSWKQNTTKKSKTLTQKTLKTLNEISRIKRVERYNEEQESIMRSKRMVELCEQPYYDIKPE